MRARGRGEWRMRARNGGVETVGGDSNETGLVVKKGKQKPTTGIGANLTLEYRDKGKSNNNFRIKPIPPPIVQHMVSTHQRFMDRYLAIFLVDLPETGSSAREAITLKLIALLVSLKII